MKHSSVSKESQPQLITTPDGASVLYRGLFLYSKYRPLTGARRSAESYLPLADQTLYFLPSPLLGYGLEILLDNLPENSVILSIEADQKLMALSSSILSDKIVKNPSFFYYRTDSPSLMDQLLDKLSWFKFRKVQRLGISQILNDYHDIYARMEATLRSNLHRRWRNRMTVVRLGKNWVINFFKNIGRLPDSAFHPDISKPVCLAGAGPSLDTDIDWLRDHQNQLFIIAVDTALKPLLSRNIRIDLVIALETQFYNYGDFYHAENSGIPVLADLTAFPNSVTATGGPHYFFYTRFWETSFYDNLIKNDLIKMELPPLGSVGVTALEIVKRISSGAVFYTGLDFSYIPGQTHSKGSVYHNWVLATGHRLEPNPLEKLSLKRPLIREQGKQTDRILLDYARSAKECIRNESRFMALNDQGITLGEQTAFTEPIRNKILGIHKDLTSEKKQTGNLQSKKKSVIQFLNQERKKLLILINTWQDFNSGAVKVDTVLESFKGLDYITISFPDPLPHPRNDPAFLFRAVILARKVLGIIDNHLEKLGKS